ncbi:MAG: hypothetical protein RL222_1708 [Bacteroidota bacterium]
MVVIAVAIGLFVHGVVLSELMFGDQLALHQYVQRVVYGGTAHIVLVVLHLKIQLLRIEVVFAIVDFFQDRKPLRRFTLFVIF